ncbi:MAG: RNA-binding domain-containing protein [Muricoprocola sp.]
MKFQESELVELKTRYVEDIRKEIIAFANSNGGTIYVGVDDNGDVVGVDDPDGVSLQISNSCRDAIKPDITMFLAYEIIDVSSKKVVAVRVQRGTSRPYYLGTKGLKPSGVYIRQGNSSAPASDIAIRQMIKETDGDRFEDMRSLNQDLTFDELTKAFFLQGLELKNAQMRTLGLINSENMYTNLALLLSDQCPHIIKAATFRGSNQEEFQDRKEFSGSLLKQLNDAYSYLDMRNQTKATFEGLYRTDSKDYSDSALREALLNAIVHRDYSFSASTLISVYENRMEIVSYGGLAGAVSLEDVLYGLSVCRNQKLANIFYRLRLIEAYGTGLKKIRDAYNGRNGKPEFMAGPNSFKVVLPNMNMLEPVECFEYDEEMKKALAFISEKGKVSRSDIEKHLGLSTSGAIRLMRKLRDRELVMVVGKGKNVKYSRNIVNGV